jgi:acyl-coenzyme A synthetase/AMP-(fatty) acid ligase
VVIPWRFRDFDHFAMIQELQPALPGLRHTIVMGERVPPGTISLEEMLHQPLEDKYPPDFLEKTRFPATEFSLVGHTTGTTGFPKFVEMPVSSHIYLSRILIEDIHLTADDALIALAPTAMGPNVPVYFCAPEAAARIVMMPAFDAEEALRLCQEERVTVLCGVPAMLAMMVECPNLGRYDLSSVRMAFSAGASVPYALAVAVEEKLGCRLVQMYGAMDAGGITRTALDDPQEARWLSAGKPLPGSEVKLVDGSGQEVPRGEVGEIMARGPTMDFAYFQDPEATW